MSYELKHIRGIPYYLDGTTVRTFEVTNGGSSPDTVEIGTYDAATNSIKYYTDWRERVKSRLAEFNSSLVPQERENIRKFIVKPTKPRKTPPTPRKSTRSKKAENK